VGLKWSFVQVFVRSRDEIFAVNSWHYVNCRRQVRWSLATTTSTAAADEWSVKTWSAVVMTSLVKLTSSTLRSTVVVSSTSTYWPPTAVLMMSAALRYIIIIIIYSFNVKLTSATFNNASTRYIINPKACKRKRLIVCPKAKNNFYETYFKKLSLQTEQMGRFMAKNTKNRQTTVN